MLQSEWGWVKPSLNVWSESSFFLMQRNALNIKTVTKQVWFYFIRGTTCTRPGYARTITNLQIVLILNTPQNPCLLIKLPKKYLPKFSYPKKFRNRKFKPKKILRPSALSLEIRSTPRLPMLPVVYPPTFSQSNEIEIWEIFALSLGRDFRNCPSDFRGFPTIFRRLPKTSEDVQANFDHFRSHLTKRRQFKRVLISLGHAKSPFNALLEHFHGN